MGNPGKDEHDDAATGQDPLVRYVELRRHTDDEGDRLTPQGAADAEKIGRDLLHPPYAAFVSTGAARATQLLEIVRHAAGQDDTDHPGDGS
jgi:broad specificity phosphatase PhoE